MINRNNQYTSVNKEELNGKLKRGKKALVTISGLVLSAILLSGCGTSKHYDQSIAYSSYDNEAVSIEYTDIQGIDMSIFDDDIFSFQISYSNISDISILSNYKYLKYVDLDSNLITDISALENLPYLESLSITNNSVYNINIQNFKNLKRLCIKGNYNLYTDELLDYCETNGIKIDITREDVKNVSQIREWVESLNLEGKSVVDKERAIYTFVKDHLKYDFDLSNSIDYNLEPLKYAVQGEGVCINYATLFDAMCEVAGINCYQIEGAYKDEGHAWNLVEIEGQYYLCDATWDDQNMPFGLFEERFFNAYGRDAEKFIEDHIEGTGGIGFDYSDLKASNVRNNMAINSTRIEGDSMIERVIDKVQEVKEGLKSKGIDMQDLISKILIGMASGTVIMLPIAKRKKIKEAIERKKKHKQLVKKNKEERKKNEQERKQREEKLKLQNEKTRHTVTYTNESNIKISKKPDLNVPKIKIEEPKKEEQPEIKKKVTIEEALNSLQTDEEKINYLKEESFKLLKKAAEEQVDLELYTGHLDKTFIDEKVALAMKELLYISTMSLDERAIYRCQRDNYLPKELDVNALTNLQREGIEATKRMYSKIDAMIKEYLKMQLLAEEFKNNMLPQNSTSIKR